MKIRNGFVSNSSSSSFVIAIKNEAKPPCETCGRPFHNDLAKKINDVADRHYESEVDAEGKEVIKHIKENWGWDGKLDDEYKVLITQVKKYLELGWEIMYLDVSYHDELIPHLIEDPSVKVLYDGSY